MKAGDVIINPHVSKEFKGKPNPMYKSMVIHIGTEYTTTLRIDGKQSKYYTRDCKGWEVSHHIDFKTCILKEQKND